MPGESIFSDDWRECLKAHYKTVVSAQDARTERTLRGVMVNVGFNEAELNELRLLATMHVDDVGEDFVPDLRMFEAVIAPAGEAKLAEVAAASDVGATHGSPLQNEIPIVVETEPEAALEIALLEDDAEENAEEAEEEPPRYDESGPQQMSLF